MLVSEQHCGNTRCQGFKNVSVALYLQQEMSHPMFLWLKRSKAAGATDRSMGFYTPAHRSSPELTSAQEPDILPQLFSFITALQFKSVYHNK